jgi:site-specific DNA-methyltransferase (adenine-specific)
MDVMPNLCDVDLLCTDPAYRLISGGMAGRQLGGIFGDEFYDNKGQLFPTLPYAEWLPAARATLATNADLFVMANDKNVRDCLNEYESNGIGLHNIFCWAKSNKTANKWGMKQVEFILYGWVGNARNLNDMGLSQLFHDANPIGKDKRHPTQKPVSLMQKLVSNATDIGGLVLDPFMGSGSTLVGAKRCGRRAIGIELNEEHCQAAAEWLETIEAYEHQVQVMFGEDL